MHGAAAANVVRLVPLAAVLIVAALAPRRRLSAMAVQFGAPLMVLVATLYGHRFERHDLGRRIMGKVARDKGQDARCRLWWIPARAASC
jgi:hypothetical protein